MNIFEYAARTKLRFNSSKGPLTVEQLFDLPLQTTVSTRVDLDQIGRQVLAERKALGEESLIETAPNPRFAQLSVALEIVKFIIDDKQAQAKAVADRAARRAKRDKILDAIAAQEDKALQNSSLEDLKAQLAALDD